MNMKKNKENPNYPGFLYRDSDHAYFLFGKEMTGVTSVLKVAGDSSGLQIWYANLATAAAFLTGTPQGWKEAYEAVIKKFGKLTSEAARELDKIFPVFKEARLAAMRVRDTSADVGKAAHLLCEEFEEGRKDFDGVDEEILKRAKPYLNWYNQNIEETLFVEKPLFSASMFIGGTPDGGFKTKDGKFLINDKKFKNSIFGPHPFWQMAGYRIMIEEMASDETTPVRIEWKDGEVEEYKSAREYLGSLGGVKWDGSVVLLMDPSFDVKPMYRYAYEQDAETFKAALRIYREEAAFKL